MRYLTIILIALATCTMISGQEAGKDKEKKNKFDRRREVKLKEGDAAPDFTLKDADGKNPVKLSELKGKPVVLIFGSCT
jgi:cytochrome oxidase Cu insertion factor (SCO1/SenC/PrrC family)